MDINLAKKRFVQQRSQSKGRVDKNGDPIAWQLTFDEWCQIWFDSGHWDQRGIHKGQYVMSRKDDIGPYSKDNVVIVQTSINVSLGIRCKSGIYKKGPEHKMYGRKMSEKTKLKISLGNKGKTPWNKRLIEKEI